MRVSYHYGVVTLVHGNSLEIWDLDDDAPWHFSDGCISDGSRPYAGAVVRITIENGAPEVVEPSSEKNLTLQQKETLVSVIDTEELGAFTAAFLLQCLHAIGCHNLRLDD